MKYKVEKATEKDGIEMLEIIESIPAKGAFELIYTRRPNAYLSYQKEGDRVNVGVIKDENGKIVLQGSCIVNDYYLNNKVYPIGYVGGFRKRQDFHGKFNWMELAVNDKVSNKCDLYYCSILSMNKHAKDVFTKKRNYMPNLEKICDYTTYIINPKIILRKKWLAKKNEYIFKKVTKKDLPNVYDFLHQEGSKYNFFPYITNIEKEFYNLHIDNCYIMLKNNKIVSFCGLWNQTDYKQYIVTKYNRPLNILTKLGKITETISYIPMPKTGEVLDFPMLSFMLVENNNIELYKEFLYYLAQEIKKEYDIFVIGINNNSIINKEIYSKIRCLKFQSTLYFMNFSNKKIKHENDFYIESGLL
ncbi:MAG: hypothetical protein VZS44_03945 [Bacilli bacterium]|nr:hypothetical protein [Bacilli bacterium]